MAVAPSAVAAERGGPRHGGLEKSLRATIGSPEAAVLGGYSGARGGPVRGTRRRRGDRHAGCGPAWASSAATTRLPHRTRRKICNPFIFNMLQDILGDRVQFRAQFAVGLKRTSLAVRGLWTGGPVDRPGWTVDPVDRGLVDFAVSGILWCCRRQRRSGGASRRGIRTTTRHANRANLPSTRALISCAAAPCAR